MLQDSTKQSLSTLAGIPDPQIRITILVVMTFLLVIAIVLIFARMKELDALDSNDRPKR